MPQNKKHHFVPRFYLKRFSPNKKSINIWNIRSQKRIQSAKLYNQCYKDFFYGKDQAIESALSDIEGATSQLLRLIDHYNLPPPLGTEHHFLLSLFVVMQIGRTAYAAETLDEMHNALVQHVLVDEAVAEGIDLSMVKVGVNEPGRYSLGLYTSSYPLFLDLHYKLLINNSGVDFITSDNPVALYNQLFSFAPDRCNTGLTSKGLQVFFPIDSRRQIVFYDPAVYRVGRKFTSTVYVDLPRDVYEINTLQVCSANDNIYFSSPTFDVEALYRKASTYRREKKSTTRAFSQEYKSNKDRELITSSKNDLQTNLSLSFVRLTAGAKRFKKSFQRMKVQPITLARNNTLIDDHQEFTRLVAEGRYNPSGFIFFINDKYGKK